jgi:hypothetical protein
MTRNHSWNVAFQQQVGDNMAFSTIYRQPYDQHVGRCRWKPGRDSGRRNGHQPARSSYRPAAPNIRELLDGPDLRRELSLVDPAVGHWVPDWITDAGWQTYHGLML